MNRPATPTDPLQELYHKFDGADDHASNARLAWYGQCRAKGMDHDEAVLDTARHYRSWVLEVWPKRDIPIPGEVTP